MPSPQRPAGPALFTTLSGARPADGLSLQPGRSLPHARGSTSSSDAFVASLFAGEAGGSPGGELRDREPSISKSTADLLEDAIAQSVSAACPHPWRARAKPPKADPLGLERLGITTSHGSRKKPPGREGSKSPAPAQQGPVRYLTIPEHALKGFKAYARGVAAEATLEVATRNPYVKALRDHRQELEEQANLSREETVYQQMGSSDTGGSMFVTMPDRDARFHTGCAEVWQEPGQDPPAASCGAYGVDFGEMQLFESSEGALVQQEPTCVQGGVQDWKAETPSASSDRPSVLSTVCSPDRSVGEDGFSGRTASSDRPYV